MELYSSTFRCNGGIAIRRNLKPVYNANCMLCCLARMFMYAPISSFLCPFSSLSFLFHCSSSSILETSASTSAPVISSWWPVILPASSSLRWHAL